MSLARRAAWTVVVVALIGGVAAVVVYRGTGAERTSLPEKIQNDARGFRDEAEESGLDFKMTFLPMEQGENFKMNLYDHGCGVVAGDYNGDGHDDLFFLNQLGANALYRNRGDGTFEDVTEGSGLGLADRICVAGTFSDYDNDGDQDLYVTSTRGGNVLFENVGNGRFADVTERAGVGLVAHSQTAAFFDPDRDGDLDLLVTNSAGWTTETFDRDVGYYVGPTTLASMFGAPREYNVYYENQGDGKFTDATQSSGLRGRGWGGDIVAFDYDADGDIDVFITNMFGLSQLYANDGAGHFRDVTAETVKRTSFGAIGSKAFDFNNDGWLDLYSVDMHSDMWMSKDASGIVKPKERYPYVTGEIGTEGESGRDAEAQMAELLEIQYDQVIFGNTLFQNLGGGDFKEISDRANTETFWPWGVATGDFDNDAYEDVFVPSGMGHPYWYHPSALLMNNGDNTFAQRASRDGIEPPKNGMYLPEKIGGERAPRSSRSAITGDFNADGRLDLVVNNFNDHPYYFVNHFPQRNWLEFKLTGKQSNRDAIGAVVTLHIGQEKKLVRQVHSAGGYLSQSSKTVHFGLGDVERVQRVEIRWPNGQRQTMESPAINQLHPIVEEPTG